jgi:hypothetical protein
VATRIHGRMEARPITTTAIMIVSQNHPTAIVATAAATSRRQKAPKSSTIARGFAIREMRVIITTERCPSAATPCFPCVPASPHSQSGTATTARVQPSRIGAD